MDERRDPLKATVAAGRYLTELHGALGHWYLAWAGYNAGGEKLRRMVERRGTSDFWALSDGKGLAKETKHYVPKLIACALVAKHPRAFGFSDDEFEFQRPLEFDEVPVVEPTDLEVLARAAGTSAESIRELNPELRRWCTPPASAARPYLLRVPRGTKDTVVAALARIPAQERLTYRIHHVRKGDTLSRIALQYHSAPEAILQFNRLRSAKTLRMNTELAVPVPSSRRAGRRRARPRAAGGARPRPGLRGPRAGGGGPRRHAHRACPGAGAGDRRRPRWSTARRACSTACRAATRCGPSPSASRCRWSSSSRGTRSGGRLARGSRSARC